MEKLSGLVLEVRGNECIVLAPGNKYLRLSMPDIIPAIGDLVEGYPVNTIHALGNRRVSRIWAYVASILITVVLSGYQVYAVTSAPSAYVSLDMAPSIELVLNSRGKVIKTKSYNDQGTDLLQKVAIDTLPVDQALRSLVKEAVHLSPPNNPDGVAILTFTDSSYLNRDDLNTLMLDTLKQEQFKGQLIVDQVDRKFRNKSTLSQISPGQQLAIDLAEVNSINLSPDEFRQNPISAVLKEHSIKLKTLIDNLRNYNNDFTGLNFSQISVISEGNSDASSLLPILYQKHTPATNASPETVAQVSVATNPVALDTLINPTPDLTVPTNNTNTSPLQSVASESKDLSVKQSSKPPAPEKRQDNKDEKDTNSHKTKDTNSDKANDTNKHSTHDDSDRKGDLQKVQTNKQNYTKKVTQNKHQTVMSL